MGCNSSAPNVIEAHNSTDKAIHFSEDGEVEECKFNNEETIKRNENELKIENGHKCDTVNDVQLDRNIFYIQNDSTNDENIGDDQNKQNDQNDENLRAQEKISTLKEVVEHVLSNNTLEKQENIEKNSSVSNLSQVGENDEETDTNVEEGFEETVPVTTSEELKEDLQELASPSQSDCSRATRWEALADMAAELPPSLTVDPITGQIYALSK